MLAHCAKKLFTLLDLCVSSLRRGHANLLCIVPILTDVPEGIQLCDVGVSPYCKNLGHAKDFTERGSASRV